MIEAMAMGKPIVGSRTGGIREAVIEGETGMLCELNEFAPTIIKLTKGPAAFTTDGASRTGKGP